MENLKPVNNFLSKTWAMRRYSSSILLSIFNHTSHFQDFMCRAMLTLDKSNVIMSSGEEKIVLGISHIHVSNVH